jgi:hypothetical protein
MRRETKGVNHDGGQRRHEARNISFRRSGLVKNSILYLEDGSVERCGRISGQLWKEVQSSTAVLSVYAER